MSSTHSIENLRKFHKEAMLFFEAEISMIKAVIPEIKGDRLSKTASLLMSSVNTGAALLQLAAQTDSFLSETMMLARSFMEKLTNFCYANICDEKEYRAFILHPVYKNYHVAGSPLFDEDPTLWRDNIEAGKKRQEKLKKAEIVQEALDIFSETKNNLNWTKKTMSQRIDALQTWGKFLDVFFTISKYEYYGDASEALHGSLYACMLDVGIFEKGFDPTDTIWMEKRKLKEAACVLLHLGMLVHECFTLIKYSTDINDIWEKSYKNRANALNLLFHVTERKLTNRKVAS